MTSREILDYRSEQKRERAGYSRFVFSHPLTTCAVVGSIIVGIRIIARLDYDDQGIGYLLFRTEPVWAFPFWLARNILWSVGPANRLSAGGFEAATWILGFLIAFAGDFFIRALRRLVRRRRPANGIRS